MRRSPGYAAAAAVAFRMRGGPAPVRVRFLRTPRPFVRLGGRRAAILRFRLPRRSIVVFEVRQLAPACRPVGLFRVNGRAGANRVRFAGRVSGRTLRPGTYELRARGFAGIRVRVAVLARGATLATGAARLRANACLVTTEPAATLVADTGTPPANGTSEVADDAESSAPAEPAGGVEGGSAGGSAAGTPPAPSQPATPQGEPGDRSAGGALGRFSPADTAFGTLALILLVAGIGAAMMLLGAAALPGAAARGPRFGALVADRRLEFALGGTAMLLVVTVAYLLAVS